MLAGISGFGIARYTAPSAGIVSSSQDASLIEPAQPDSLKMSIDAIREAGITTEVLQPGGLDAEIGAQAVVAPQPGGEAIVTARASGAVDRKSTRLNSSH